MIARRWHNTAIFAAAATVTSVFFIDFCAAVFHCGCVSLWRGADAHCNIHAAGTHHCPWCAGGMAASLIPWALIVAVQAAIGFWPRAVHPGVRLASALCAFPLAGGIVAMLYGLATGYWQ
ncbi:MAG TPA: hypothetical protein VMH28_06655 [Candidatus Acidoferrales bacterium]|nr:hypothetical protein [Candidatus Acidoferrales bacterium]